MNSFFLFLFKAALVNALMLGFYHFAIRPGRNLRLMRAVLLMAILLPLILPFIHFKAQPATQSRIPVYEFTLPQINQPAVIAPQPSEDPWITIQNLIYGVTAASFFAAMIASIIAIVGKYLRATQKQTRFGKIFIENSSLSPYSFFSWVFFSEKSLSHPDAEYLLRHEFSHVNHRHSFDRLISGLFRSFLWFSPFAHFNHRLLSEVHEYQADADAIGSHDQVKAYNHLLLSFTGFAADNAAANPFSAHLKKRILMINNLKPRKIYFTRIAAGVTVIAAFALLSSMVIPAVDQYAPQSAAITAQNISSVIASSDDTILPAEFPGGEEARIRFFMNNIQYPQAAREQNIQGTVTYKIFIEPDGSVSSPSIISGIGGGCDEEVLRVVALMPKWKPAVKDGKPVRTSVVLPLKFSLSGGDSPLDKDQVFTVVENPPKYPGGNEAMVAYLQKAVVYPAEARKQKLEGTVFVSFVVETDGRISSAKVLRGIGGGCDESALSAVQNMPPWEPGTQRGKAVRVQYNLPIKFNLGNNKEKASTYQVPADRNKIQDDVFTVVEKVPVFKGGQEALTEYMKSAVVYPDLAKKDKIEGTVYVTFVVEKDGKVSEAKVLRGIGGGCDESALAAIQHMPAWEPGMQHGQPVRVQFNIPVKFGLDNQDKPTPSTSIKTNSSAENNQKEVTDNEVFVVVEEIPEFPGGEAARLQYIAGNIQYPQSARAKGIEGIVYVTFVVSKDGKVTKAKVLRGVYPSLDAEALRVINSMPDWKPGRQHGKPVNVQFNVPIKFSLSKK